MHGRKGSRSRKKELERRKTGREEEGGKEYKKFLRN